MKTDSLPTAVVVAALQAAWNSAAEDFAEAIERECSGDRDAEPTIPEEQDRHEAADLWLDLDDCIADEEYSANYAYGHLHAIHALASDLGVSRAIRFDFPRRQATDA